MRLSAGLVLLAAALAVFKALGDGPAHLQTGEISTVYTAVRAYELAAIPITGVILAGCAWIVARLIRERRNTWMPVVVAGAALVWAGASTLPRFFVSYDHLHTVSSAEEDYHLGVRTALDGDYFWIVSKCARGQFRCSSFGVAPVDAAEHGSLSRARLTAGNTSSALVIHTVSRTIPFQR